MSRRVELSKTPLSHPSLFTKVPADPTKIVPGDIFRGVRNPQKWYQNTDDGPSVDTWRDYYRPVDLKEVTITVMPLKRMSPVKPPAGLTPADKPQHEEVEEQAGETAAAGVTAVGETVPILMMTWSLNVPGLKRLIDEVKDL